ncbi:MET5 (YJR137C) [Zygosaccharomyces parabailii]|nr:MET5 (YJR137C) [Zygosaccharomyces parabailii]CDH11362.1 probable Sulfite reductase [NADPH] subunit beta [Zygosaccharomyces bailii ISA1307]
MTITGSCKLPEALLRCAQAVDSYKIFYTTATKDTHSEYAHIPQAVQLLSHADPLSEVVEQLSTDSLTTLITDETTLVKSLPHVNSLQGFPVVVNVDLSLQDYSAIASFKDLSIPILISSNPETLTQNANRAIEVATKSVRPVLHFINFTNIRQSIDIDVKPTTIAEDPVDLDSLELEHNFELVSRDTPLTAVVDFSAYEFGELLPLHTCLAKVNVYRPWNFNTLLQMLPSSVKKIVVVQSANQKSSQNGFEPLLLDFFSDFDQLVERGIDQVIISNIGIVKDVGAALEEIVLNVNSAEPDLTLFVGDSAKDEDAVTELSASLKNVLNLENAYMKVVRQLFSPNLHVLNEYTSETVQQNNPEYGYGLFLNQDRRRQYLISLARRSLDPSLYSKDGVQFVQLLGKWLAYHDQSLDENSLKEANVVAHEIFEYIEKNQVSKKSEEFLQVGATEDAYRFKSTWLIGSDAWSYDLGNSGVHQVLSSKKNINVLLIDSEPYQHKSQSHQRKKDVGLYAMNFGHVYVASVAVYSSYSQLLTATLEAAKFNGPSIVLAYLPYHSENDTPLQILKETKVAVESGYWPLYRYDPSKPDEDAFALDSSVVKRELQKFLDRENRLTLLSKKYPDFSRNLAQSASDNITKKQERRAKQAYDQLLEGLSGPPLHVYYASDGGNAASLAKRLSNRAAARGLKSTVMSMDDVVLEDLPGEENVVFITSTAGQGEFPQDGKALWDALKASTDLDLNALNFSVFGLGDSLYWPRKEDKHYYNRPSRELFKKLEVSAAKPLVPLGQGDDQDADGYQTAYGPWEESLWEALGVAGAAVPEEPKPWTNEDMKINSDFLRGTIVEGLADDTTGAIHAYDQQLTKFHGIYMQDDRDVRDVRKAQGMEPYYAFMARIRLPGGKATPEQWLVLDRLSNETGNGTIKLTTRATFQLHGVVKRNLKHTIRAMNSTLMDTLAACGDVNRNVMLSAIPHNAKVHQQISDVGYKISEYFLPNTTAYHEIWLSGIDDRDYDPDWPSIFENRKEGPTKKKTKISGDALVDVEPLYGPTYLPRKFKVNITVPPYNDVDVWSSDVGLVSIIDAETQELQGFNMYVGGGMGTTHNNKKTYPRTGSLFGYLPTEDIIKAIEGVMVVQRDNGDRNDRKHARLKYTLDDMGVEVFKAKVEEYMGKKFQAGRPFEIKTNHDYFGWVKDETGLNHFTAFIENGRVEDTVELPQKTGMKRIAQLMQRYGSGHFRLTGNQHAVISGIKDEHLDDFKKVLHEYKLDNTAFSALRLHSASCVGLPTCGLAMAESERYLPELITKLENILEGYGLRHDSVVMRMTGCPNGCARPWLGEVALIGKAPLTYNLMLGGGYYGQRINKLYRASIKEEEVIEILKELFKRWSQEREEDEHFGDFLIRVGVIKPTLEGKYFHEDIPEEAL